MNQDTKDFLVTLLWLADAPDAEEAERLQEASVYDFSAAFVAAVEAFIDGFRAHLEKKGYKVAELIGRSERSFGGNVYLSLSGHGAGFFDDCDGAIAELHDVLKTWAGGNRFEELGYSIMFHEDGKIDLDRSPQYLEAERANIFKVPETADKKAEVTK